MKKLTLLLLLLITANINAQVEFDKYFTNKTLRFDYNRAGNSTGNNVFFEQIKEEPFWSGSKASLLDKFEYGHYKFMVYDLKSNTLIYTRGYNTLFDEWQSTPEAKVMSRTFYETVIFPYPKGKVKIELHERKRDGNFALQYEQVIDPDDKFIRKEKPVDLPVLQVAYNGEPMEKVDLVFLPDGYAADEIEQFKADVKKYTDYLFGCSPFKENRGKFNIWAVLAPSPESGVDNPGTGKWKNNLFGMTYYTQDVERYLMSGDIKTIRDYAALTPYDNIMIISNSDLYGGGAIYNYYTSFPNKNKNGDYLIVHEFGHNFCALGDEYYTSEVGVDEYYNLNVEPYEANLTTLVNFGKKWKSMMDSKTPIPTPSTNENKSVLGVYEGGGYVPKGIFRPKQDCTMKSISYDNFCPVCTKALTDMINYYAN